MADTVSPTHVASERLRKRVRCFAKRLAQVVISYEVATYALATVQATGLTLPTMVDPTRAGNAALCRTRLQNVVEEAARFRAIQPAVPLLALDRGVGAAIIKEMPQCPTGGRYELLPSGTSVVVEGGASVVTSVDRLAARCVHHEGTEVHPGVALARIHR